MTGPTSAVVISCWCDCATERVMSLSLKEPSDSVLLSDYSRIDYWLASTWIGFLLATNTDCAIVLSCDASVLHIITLTQLSLSLRASRW